MGLFSRKDKDDRPMTDAELNERSRVDGIRFKELQVVAQLMKIGADLKAPRHTLFYLYFPDEASAAPVAEALRGAGLSAEVKEPWEKVREWAVIAECRDRALIPDFLRDTVDLCEELAAAHGGEYDGWEAGMTEAEAAARKKG